MREQIDNFIPRQFQPFVVGGVIFLIVILVYFTMMRSESMSTIDTFPTNEQAQALAIRLESGADKVKATIHETEKGFEVRVPTTQDESARRMNSLVGQADDFKKIKCTKPGSFASSGDKDAYKACQVEAKIQKQVAALPGVLAADATFDQTESSSLTGDDYIGEATVQIMRDPNAKQNLDGESMASIIAGTSTALSPERIIIQDTNGQTIWNGAHPTGETAMPAGCSPDAMDLQCQTRSVKAEMERDLSSKIGGIVGGSENVKVSVAATLNPSSKIETQTTSTDGAKLTENRMGNDSGQTSYSPSIDSMQSTTQPGNVEVVRVSVLLNGVKPSIEDAVRDWVGNQINVRRGDSLSVRTTKWETEKQAESEAAAEQAAATNEKPVIDEKAAAATKTLIVGGFIALVLAGAAIALLWRRSQRLTSERTVFEDEFRRDMTRYQSVADRTPQALAEEIETWLNQQGGPRSGASN